MCNGILEGMGERGKVWQPRIYISKAVSMPRAVRFMARFMSIKMMGWRGLNPLLLSPLPIEQLKYRHGEGLGARRKRRGATWLTVLVFVSLCPQCDS